MLNYGTINTEDSFENLAKRKNAEEEFADCKFF